MLDFSTPFAWIWLASLILITSLVFKRHVLLFWLLVCPPIIALKMQVPFLVIAAGIGGVMTGLIFHPDAWFKPLGIPERGFSMVYLVVGFISALVIFMLFIRSNRPTS